MQRTDFALDRGAVAVAQKREEIAGELPIMLVAEECARLKHDVLRSGVDAERRGAIDELDLRFVLGIPVDRYSFGEIISVGKCRAFVDRGGEGVGEKLQPFALALSKRRSVDSGKKNAAATGAEVERKARASRGNALLECFERRFGEVGFVRCAPSLHRQNR